MQMTPNEYRLNGMAHWCHYGQSMRWDGEALRLPYMTGPAELTPDPITFYYRLNADQRFIANGHEFRINDIQMQLQDGSWEVIERVINAR